MTATEFRATLKALGISQKWLAERFGVDPGTVNRWAKGRVPVPQYVAFCLELLKRHEPAIKATAPNR